MALLKAKKGIEANLDNVIEQEGQLLYTTDTNELYIDAQPKKYIVTKDTAVNEEKTYYRKITDSNNNYIYEIVTDISTIDFSTENFYEFDNTLQRNKLTINNSIKEMGEKEVAISKTETIIADPRGIIMNDTRERTYNVNGTVASGNIATNWDTLAIGRYNTASGDTAIASGSRTVASGDCSIATGFKNTASGEYSVVLGSSSEASGYQSLAKGQGVKAKGAYSVAMGRNAETTEDANTSFSFGEKTIANGDHSFATGYNS